MALNGTFYGTTSNDYIQPKIVWSATQDATGNYSMVTATLYYSRTNSGYTTQGIGTFGITINGTTKSESTRIEITYNSNTVAVTNTVKVPHNADGTKKITISGSGSISGTTLSSTTISSSVTLNTIPRKSSLTASNGTLGTAQTLKVTRQSTSFTHTITYKCGSASGTICSKSSSTSISWTPALSLASQNTTGTSVSITLTITTYSGSTNIGSNTKTISCSIPAGVKPTLTVDVTDPNGYADMYGAFVRGLSKFKVVITPTLAYGSAIKSYKSTADGGTYTSASFTTGVLSSSGTLNVASTITDNRGRSNSKTVAIPVLNYNAPSISKLDVRRCEENGAENDRGEYVQVSFSASVVSLNDLNTASYMLRYKPSVGSVYIENAFETLSDKYSVVNHSFIFAADGGSSYDVELVVTDNHNTTRRATTVSTGFTLMHWNAAGDGIAFGKISEKSEAFECALDIFDRFGTKVSNGLAVHTSDDAIDPDTTLEWLILTNKNTPHDAFFYIETKFYGDKSASADRTQIAYPYSATINTTYRRVNRDGVWSEWTNIYRMVAETAVTEDPDTTVNSLILTNTNTPMGSGYYMYIYTMFYGNPATTKNKAQYALPHRNIGSMYHRYCVDGTWADWRRHLNADEITAKTISTTKADQASYELTSIAAYSRSGMVDIHIQAKVVTASSSWLTVATLPSGYRPPVNIYSVESHYNSASGNANIRMRILPAGSVQLSLGTAGASYAFHDTFIMA